MDSVVAGIEACPWGFLGVLGTGVLASATAQQGCVDVVAPAQPQRPPEDKGRVLAEALLCLAGLVLVVTQVADGHTQGWCSWMHLTGAQAPVFLLALAWSRTTCPRSSRGTPLPGMVVVLLAEAGRLCSRAATSSSVDALDVATVGLLGVVVLLKLTAAVVCRRQQKKTTGATKATQRRRGKKEELSAFAQYSGDLHAALLADEEDEEEDEEEETTPPSPLDQAGFLSRLGFGWVNPLLSTGAKRQLTYDDIPPLAENDSTSLWARRFQNALEAERAAATRGNRRPSLLRVAHVTFGREYYYCAGLQLLNDLLGFSAPILLKLVVTFVQDFAAGTTTMNHGYALFAVLLLCYGAAAILSTQYSLRMARVQLHVRTALVTAIYRQVLACRAAQLGASSIGSAGAVTNLMTVDVQRVQDAASSFNTFWSLPLQVGLTLYLLYREVSYAFVAGLVVLALMVPINMAIAKAITRVSQRQMRFKDARVQACDEMLHGVKAIKTLAWEDHLAALLGRLRGQEVRYLAQRKYLDAWCVYFWAATPVLTSLATFVAVVQLEHDITPAAVFTTIALLNMLIFPMNAFPWVINGLMEAIVSKRRLQRFLLGMPPPPQYVEYSPAEVERLAKKEEDDDGKACVEAHGSFGWEEELDRQSSKPKQDGEEKDAAHLPEREVDVDELEGAGLVEASSVDAKAAALSSFCIQDLNLCVRRGEVVGVYGKIGAGKSTLLAALLGEVYAAPGSRVKIQARRQAYVAQTPWLQRGSIQDNIVFGQPWDPIRFDEVVAACGLQVDLATMRDGAQTEIGERGGTLSGGQRLRVALARALYSHADVYWLDDPFSGLDARTARHVATEAIYGMMRREKATVVLVTHALPLLDGCDWAVAMQGGRLVQKISFRPKTAATRRRDEKAAVVPQPPPPVPTGAAALTSTEAAAAAPSPTALALDETREEGKVKWGVVSYYIQSTGRLLCAAILLCLLGMQLSANAFTFWLSIWSSHTEDYTANDFLVVSGIIAATNTTFTLLRAFLFAYGGLRAATLLHDKLLRAVLGAAMSFFESHPVGRILNRFAGDTWTIDDSLPFISNIFLAQAVGLLGTTIVLLIASPWSVVVLLVVTVVYQRLQTFYRTSSREIKRLDSVSRSPIFALFSETMDGASTVRAFGATDMFLARNLQLVDGNQRVGFAGTAASQWLALRLQAFGLLVVASVAAWAVGSCAVDHPVSAGLIGLSLSYTLPLVGNLSGLLSAYTETEKEMVAVERVHEFTEQPTEPDVVGGKDALLDVPAQWPQAGRIVVEDLTLTYRAGWAPALNHVQFTIHAGEKVGVCGRTGSGKTTLLSTLFRLVPWQEGRISIDGLPIHRVPLKRLRSALAIIPQEPTLFAGTVRSNLDPADQYTDAELGAAMQTCHLDGILRTAALEEKRESSPSSSTSLSGSLARCLAVPVKERGSNFSVGQRQLICLCRVLLKRAQIVCVDEATASLDVATDALVRRTLTQAFRHATVIMIAHRMATVLELCGRVLVLSEGRLVEEGDPKVLVQDLKSHLARLGAEEKKKEEEEQHGVEEGMREEQK